MIKHSKRTILRVAARVRGGCEQRINCVYVTVQYLSKSCLKGASKKNILSENVHWLKKGSIQIICVMGESKGVAI